MELVYLWVEEYKNIHRQGFNFSPRFNCKYDPDSNELTIDKNDDYIENFFGGNINVTAIVGKNGSGKSSVLEILSYIFGGSLDDASFEYILIYRYNYQYYLAKSYIFNDVEIIFELELNIDFGNIREGLLSEHQDLIVKKITNETKRTTIFGTNSIYRSQHFFELNIKYQNINYLKKIMLNNYYHKKIDTVSQKFFMPDKFKLNILFDKLGEDNPLFKEHKEEIDSKLYEAKDFWNDNETEQSFLKTLELMVYKSELSRKDGIDTAFMFSQYSKKNYYFKKKLKDKAFYFSKVFYDITELDESFIDFIFSLPSCYFSIELLDGDKSFGDLSFGEQQLLAQLNSIIHRAGLRSYSEYIPPQLDGEGNEWGDEDVEYEFSNVLVFLDEYELGLHPSWQKEFMNYLINFLLPISEKRFHIILTTHSPFLLSDILKQNIIFLDTDEEGNCKVVNGLHEKKETFGANIHTLLSDSFFMSDGLMGEFAKERINQIISYLREERHEQKVDFSELWLRDKENLKRMIETIGEPFLQKKVMELYYEKYPEELDREQKRRELERQRGEIDRELSRL